MDPAQWPGFLTIVQRLGLNPDNVPVSKKPPYGWGGALGPKMLSHVKCKACGSKYNGKTGGDNTGAIAIYMVIAGILSFAVIFALFFFLFSR